MITSIDFVVDMSHGDSGKAAISYELSKLKYTYCMTIVGGPNKGHTIYHNNEKYVAHQIPVGIFHGIPSIIGSECFVDVKKFFNELNELEKIGISTKDKVFIAHNAHIITEEHLTEELNEIKIGTTKQGIGPCARDKFQRVGKRAESIPELKDYIVDLYDLFYKYNKSISILAEGGQGHFLDISQGNYPYVTSGYTTVAGGLLNCLPWNAINKVYGCAKAYDTYVGSNKFEPNDKIFEELRRLGGEKGATTGRPRQCNWLNLDNLIKACKINNVTNLIISKMDILMELNEIYDNKYWSLIYEGQRYDFDTQSGWKEFLENFLRAGELRDISIQYRYSPVDKVNT